MTNRICSIPECERIHFARGWCKAHYTRWSRHGSTDRLVSGVKPQAPISLFESKVNKAGPQSELVPELGRCWLWTAYVVPATGYGWFGYGGNKGVRTTAHRFSYEYFKGPIPAKHVIDHLCEVRACCNPEHLEAVTHGENLRRGNQSRGKLLVCKNGHDLTTHGRVTPKQIVCKVCNLERGREFRQRWGGRKSLADTRRKCLGCEVEFEANVPSRKFCSAKCRTSMGSDPGYYKALRLGLIAERINALDIYRGDHWECKLCGDPIPTDLRWPDPHSATLDHIVPFALKGSHILSNVQSAHLLCNLQKGSLPV